MTSPAERYSAARRRAAEVARSPELGGFAADLGFDLDPFQREACEALERGSGVLVCAPTGAGKTVVGEFAVHLALAQGRKCFYTTPIKALSNQKFHDLVQRYGPGRVGLLTGDNAINAEAPVVVMTTEVLRNMLYAGSATLTDLAYVVMDEVHYLADRFRGAVWEEVIIHLPGSVTLVSLSATVSNAEEFADWLVTVRGQTSAVDLAGGADGDPVHRGVADQPVQRRRPPGAGLLGVARRAGAGPGRPPRRDAAGVQGGGRGAVRAGPGQGRVRHRDPGPGHQHAGPLRGPRTAGAVPRARPPPQHPR